MSNTWKTMKNLVGFLLSAASLIFLTGCTTVICDVGNVTTAGYSKKALRSGMKEYNAEVGVTQLFSTDRRKYEICYNKKSKKLVRRNSNDLNKFVTFDTTQLDTSPYDQDYVAASTDQIVERSRQNCTQDEIDGKQDWNDDTHRTYRTATYVMDPEGRIYASTVFKKCIFQHSSYLAEADVSAAGEMRVEDGILMSLNNESGHYRPPAWTLRNILSELTKRGVDTAGVACSSNSHSRSDPPGPPAGCP